MNRTYRVVLTPHAKKRLEKIDSSTSLRIYSWLKETLDNSEDPCSLGTRLVGDLSGMIRYRVGDYRIIAVIRDSDLIVLVIEIEHRKKAYDRL